MKSDCEVASKSSNARRKIAPRGSSSKSNATGEGRPEDHLVCPSCGRDCKASADAAGGRQLTLQDAFMQLSQRDNTRLLHKVDTHFFEKLEVAWCKPLQPQHRHLILEVLSLGEIPKRRAVATSYYNQLEFIGKRVAKLAKAVSRLDSGYGSLPGWGSAMHFCARLGAIEAGIRQAKIHKRKEERAARKIVIGLAYVYRLAGGRVTIGWTVDEQVAGPFAAGLRLVWQILPSDVRPPTAETFARIARELKPEERGAPKRTKLQRKKGNPSSS